MSLKIATPLSLTGKFAPLGKKARNGITLWARYMESAGEHVELVIEDDESSEEKTSAITEKFCSDKTVHAVFGPYSSSLALSAAQRAAEKGKTLWNHGGATDEISDYENTVSAITPASRYFVPIVDMLAGGGVKAVAIANPTGSGFSKAVADGAEARARKLKLAVRRFEYVSGSVDFGKIARELIACGAPVLSAGGMDDDFALAERILDERGRPEFLCFVAAGVDDFFERFGVKSEEVFSVSQWEENNPFAPEPDFGPSSLEFAEMFEKEYGRRPDYPAAQAFNIGLVFQKCALESKSADDKILRETARKLDFTTFYGRFKMDADGKQSGHKMVITKWKDRKRVVVEPSGFEPPTSSMPLMRSPS